MKELELLGLWIFSIVRNSKQLESTTFRKLNLCRPSNEGRETRILLGPVERANINY
jgi:hypothetical protein